MIAALQDSLPHGGQFFPDKWSWWIVVGWLGNLTFSTRFIVQWYATEKKKQVVVPTSFWWLSVIGSLLLLLYAVGYKHDSVFTFAYAVAWIPYIRNLVIESRHARAHRDCPGCGIAAPPKANFCSTCGTRLPGA